MSRPRADIDSTEIQCPRGGTLDFSTANVPPRHIGFQYSPGLYDNVNITPLASCHWKICHPRATLCRPRAPGCCPRASSSALRPSGSIMGPSGDIMFGPWAAYFPVSLCQGCDIVPISHPWPRATGKYTALWRHNVWPLGGIFSSVPLPWV